MPTTDEFEQRPAIRTARDFATFNAYLFPDLNVLKATYYNSPGTGEQPDESVVVENPTGVENIILIHPEQSRGAGQLRIRFMGSRNIVVIGQNSLVRGLVRMHADDCATVLAGDNKQPAIFNITHWSKGTTTFIGRETTSNGSQLVLMGQGASILIGEDCMFSTGIWVKTSDMHAIVDLASGEMINSDGTNARVQIGTHAWIGQNALVVQSLSIGAGAILGANSFLNRSIPDCALFAGTPARQLREGVTWLRSHRLVSDELEVVRNRLGYRAANE